MAGSYYEKEFTSALCSGADLGLNLAPWLTSCVLSFSWTQNTKDNDGTYQVELLWEANYLIYVKRAEANAWSLINTQ